MEYCDEGTLLDYVAQGVPLPFQTLVGAFYQIASALQYIHQSNIVHFDIKLEVRVSYQPLTS